MSGVFTACNTTLDAPKRDFAWPPRQGIDTPHGEAGQPECRSIANHRALEFLRRHADDLERGRCSVESFSRRGWRLREQHAGERVRQERDGRAARIAVFLGQESPAFRHPGAQQVEIVEVNELAFRTLKRPLLKTGGTSQHRASRDPRPDPRPG
jgi:hypothetical protein